MPQNIHRNNNTNNHVLGELLNVEHQNMIHWLHDDLGQNLVAIKSFANAIIEQNIDATDDTAELADIIKQAADSAYRATYDLMQELRAQELAIQPIITGLASCIEESRLKERDISCQYHVDPILEDPDHLTKTIILRSTRCFINFSKLSKKPSTLTIELNRTQSTESDQLYELRLLHEGGFELMPGEAPSLSALRNRIEAVGGVMNLETNNRDRLTLKLQLIPLSMSKQP